jgi:hypothetical protein
MEIVSEAFTLSDNILSGRVCFESIVDINFGDIRYQIITRNINSSCCTGFSVSFILTFGTFFFKV